MDSETPNETATDDQQQKPALRERIGRRAWVRSAALVGGGLIAGGIIAGTVTATPPTRAHDPARTCEDGHRPGPAPGTTRATATRRSRSAATRSC